MNLLFMGMTFAVIGKMMLAYGVVIVHVKMAKERRIDDVVIRSFRTEMIVTLTGVAFIIIGYLMEVTFMGGFAYLLTCSGTSCGASIGSLLLQ